MLEVRVGGGPGLNLDTAKADGLRERQRGLALDEAEGPSAGPVTVTSYGPSSSAAKCSGGGG